MNLSLTARAEAGRVSDMAKPGKSRLEGAEGLKRQIERAFAPMSYGASTL